MIIYKIKRSFFLIEVLLGFFLLALFIPLIQSIPKIVTYPLIEKVIRLELNHLARRQFVENCSQTSLESLPQKKGRKSSFSLEDTSLSIPYFFNGIIHQSTEFTLIEIKATKETKIFFYEFKIFFDLKFRNKTFRQEFSYPLIKKVHCK